MQKNIINILMRLTLDHLITNLNRTCTNIEPRSITIVHSQEKEQRSQQGSLDAEFRLRSHTNFKSVCLKVSTGIIWLTSVERNKINYKATIEWSYIYDPQLDWSNVKRVREDQQQSCIEINAWLRTLPVTTMETSNRGQGTLNALAGRAEIAWAKTVECYVITESVKQRLKTITLSVDGKTLNEVIQAVIFYTILIRLLGKIHFGKWIGLAEQLKWRVKSARYDKDVHVNKYLRGIHSSRDVGGPHAMDGTCVCSSRYRRTL